MDNTGQITILEKLFIIAALLIGLWIATAIFFEPIYSDPRNSNYGVASVLLAVLLLGSFKSKHPVLQWWQWFR